MKAWGEGLAGRLRRLSEALVRAGMSASAEECAAIARRVAELEAEAGRLREHRLRGGNEINHDTLGDEE